MFRECICIHLGQGGIQSGLSTWELLRAEHSLQPDGHLGIENDDEVIQSLKILFEDKSNKLYSPRAVIMDLEPTVIDDIRCGYYSNYDMSNIISGKEEANNYARGFYTVGNMYLEPVMDIVRKVANKCDNVQAILVFHSLGGGTGAGFCSLMMDTIEAEFSKKSRTEYAIFPSETSAFFSTSMEPYNYILASNKTMDKFNCSFQISNRALHSISQKKLCIENPNYPEFNRLIAGAVSNTTAPFRFHNTLNLTINEFQVNLFPFPKAHYPIIGMAPILRQKRAFHEPLVTKSITLDGLQRHNQMMYCDLSRGVCMACCLLYRGDIIPTDINSAIELLKKKKCLTFLDCCPTGFKWEMVAPARSVCLLTNSTAIVSSWKEMCSKFDQMFQKKAFLHWYLMEGMEEQQFSDARNNIQELINEYSELDPTPCHSRPETLDGYELS